MDKLGGALKALLKFYFKHPLPCHLFWQTRGTGISKLENRDSALRFHSISCHKDLNYYMYVALHHMGMNICTFVTALLTVLNMNVLGCTKPLFYRAWGELKNFLYYHQMRKNKWSATNVDWEESQVLLVIRFLGWGKKCFNSGFWLTFYRWHSFLQFLKINFWTATL